MRKLVIKKHQAAVSKQGTHSGHKRFGNRGFGKVLIGQLTLYSLLIGAVIKLKLSFTSEIRVAPWTKESIPSLDREQRTVDCRGGHRPGTAEQTTVY